MKPDSNCQFHPKWLNFDFLHSTLFLALAYPISSLLLAFDVKKILSLPFGIFLSLNLCLFLSIFCSNVIVFEAFLFLILTNPLQRHVDWCCVSFCTFLSTSYSPTPLGCPPDNDYEGCHLHRGWVGRLVPVQGHD